MTESLEELTLGEAMAHRDRAIIHNNDIAKMWSLALAVANGASLAAVAAQLFAATGKPEATAVFEMLLPSAWLFAIGLLAAGASQATAMMMASFDLIKWERLIAQAKRDGSAEDTASNVPFALYVAGWGLEAISALIFTAGLLIPLVRISATHL